MGASIWPPRWRRPGPGGARQRNPPSQAGRRRGGAMSVSIRLRREGYQALKELCDATGVKMADAVRLWPRCPKCGSLLAEFGGVITCVKCKTAYRLQ